jgi:hypothetical protein
VARCDPRGLSAEDATERLIESFDEYRDEAETENLFWLALAATQMEVCGAQREAESDASDPGRQLTCGRRFCWITGGYAGTASRSISGAYMPVRAAPFIFARW